MLSLWLLVLCLCAVVGYLLHALTRAQRALQEAQKRLNDVGRPENVSLRLELSHADCDQLHAFLRENVSMVVRHVEPQDSVVMKDPKATATMSDWSGQKSVLSSAHPVSSANKSVASGVPTGASPALGASSRPSTLAPSTAAGDKAIMHLHARASALDPPTAGRQSTRTVGRSSSDAARGLVNLTIPPGTVKIVFRIERTVTMENDRGKQYIGYDVQYSFEGAGRVALGEPHSILKRYRQFLSLNKELRRALGGGKRVLPSFPKKKWIRNKRSKFLQKRTSALETYLNALPSAVYHLAVMTTFLRTDASVFQDDDEDYDSDEGDESFQRSTSNLDHSQGAEDDDVDECADEQHGERLTPVSGSSSEKPSTVPQEGGRGGRQSIHPVTASPSACPEPVGTSSASASSSVTASKKHLRQSVFVHDPIAAADEEVDVEEAQPEKQSLLQLLKSATGLDLTTITLPVTLNEPTSFLQRMAENIQYWELLEKAAKLGSSAERLLYVTAFVVSCYSCNTRTSKPFNPYLGETFEYEEPEKNFRFFVEQVSHHPPVGACRAETPDFVFWQEQLVRTKFGGNKLDVSPQGRSHVLFKKTQEHVSWNGISTAVHNIIIGGMWIDHFGKTVIENHTTKETSHLHMHQCGWFGKNRYRCDAVVYGANKKPTGLSLEGLWNEQLQKPDGTVVWTNHLRCTDQNQKYLLSDHVKKLMALPDELRAHLPPTDSRLRKDRLALEVGDIDTASAEKHALEERQRAIQRARQKKNQEWSPVHFVKQVDPDTGEENWVYSPPLKHDNSVES
mmetsp:Transcript_8675/g.26929  ORF Transcript_8675/g.26929 Transcript_8675/m.26929 type:complete len:793 (+) Transcript_8675:184-2562(+)